MRIYHTLKFISILHGGAKSVRFPQYQSAYVLAEWMRWPSRADHVFFRFIVAALTPLVDQYPGTSVADRFLPWRWLKVWG